MNSPNDRPSLWDIRSCLLSSIDHAEDFAQHRPEHLAAVARFSQDIQRIKQELMSSFEQTSFPSSLPDIINGLTGARAMASIIAERHPEQSATLTGFVEKLSRTQEKLIQSVRPHKQ
ncbi:MAG: hypothetical protein KGS09_12425 [Nitrospirae bacterium]|nr:hypothetical protein [Nitrospirota bacterium]MDE3042966.1 hypothetical protein [Nitrospirota bacterium]